MALGPALRVSQPHRLDHPHPHPALPGRPPPDPGVVRIPGEPVARRHRPERGRGEERRVRRLERSPARRPTRERRLRARPGRARGGSRAGRRGEGGRGGSRPTRAGEDARAAERDARARDPDRAPRPDPVAGPGGGAGDADNAGSGPDPGAPGDARSPPEGLRAAAAVPARPRAREAAVRRARAAGQRPAAGEQVSGVRGPRRRHPDSPGAGGDDLRVPAGSRRQVQPRDRPRRRSLPRDAGGVNPDRTAGRPFHRRHPDTEPGAGADLPAADDRVAPLP